MASNCPRTASASGSNSISLIHHFANDLATLPLSYQKSDLSSYLEYFLYFFSVLIFFLFCIFCLFCRSEKNVEAIRKFMKYCFTMKPLRFFIFLFFSSFSFCFTIFFCIKNTTISVIYNNLFLAYGF